MTGLYVYKKFKPFIVTLLVSALSACALGALAGALFNFGVIGTEGPWVTTLNWVAKTELDKVFFVSFFAGCLYVTGWAILGKLPRVYQIAKWTLIKTFLGVAFVPVFALVASLWIQQIVPARTVCFIVMMQAYVQATVWFYFLPSETASAGVPPQQNIPGTNT